MPTPNIDVVKTALTKDGRDLKIRSAIEQAWVDVQKKYSDRAWWRRATTLRSVMWEHSVDQVMAVVADDDGLVSIEHHDTASFIADDLVLFRLKKADRKLFSRNFPTPLASMFHKHETDLFGHEGFHRVEIVHTFNRFHTAIDWIGVVARDGKTMLWEFEICRGEGQVILMPVTPILPAGKTVVRPSVPDIVEQGEQGQTEK